MQSIASEHFWRTFSLAGKFIMTKYVLKTVYASILDGPQNQNKDKFLYIGQKNLKLKTEQFHIFIRKTIECIPNTCFGFFARPVYWVWMYVLASNQLNFITVSGLHEVQLRSTCS